MPSPAEVLATAFAAPSFLPEFEGLNGLFMAFLARADEATVREAMKGCC